MYFRNEYVESEFTQRLESMMKEAQYGTRCMNPDVYQISDYPCKEEVTTSWTMQHSNIVPECDCETTGKNKYAMTTDMNISNQWRSHSGFYSDYIQFLLAR